MPATTKFESDATAIEYGLRSALVGRGPVSNVTCQSGFQWAFDSAGNSPCLVAAAVVGGCGTGDHTVTPLANSTVHYDPPGIDSTPDKCGCSWAAYNLFSACTACQGFNSSLLTWAGYSSNCGSLVSTSTYYPSDVPTLDNTSIPYYATTNPTTWTNAIFNIDQAKNISEEGHADVYGAPLTTAPSTSSKSKSNAGAIGGGVAGGVVVLLIGAAVAWWLLRKRRIISRRKSGKPQELDSTTYSTQGHTRSFSDLTKATHPGDLGYTNGHNGYLGVIGMQQLHPSVNSSSPFGSSVNMGSISSVGLYTTPPHQSVVHVDGPASTYNDRASTIISRYDSPSPSMQFMNRSQSPDSNVVHTSFAGGVNEMGVQPFLLPPISTSPPPAPVATKYSNNPSVYDSTVVTRRNSQESIEAPPGSPPPPRRMNPPTYDDAVALSDSQQVASQRRETHGTGHRPPLPEKQPSQTSQTSQGSQDSSVWSAPTIGNANEHGPTAELAAIDAYVNRVHLGGQRPGGSSGGGATEGVDTVPMLHTTAMPPGQHSRPPASAKRSTMNTTIDDGGGSVLGGGHREGGDGDSFGIA